MEAEIQRRKEHLNDATNFEQARGFVRTNWKTKNWNPNADPTQEESSTDSDEEEIIQKAEGRDQVKDIYMSPPAKNGRDNNALSPGDMEVASLSLTQ